MISSVTTDTITVVTMFANDTSMALIAIFTLLALLLQKELVSTASSRVGSALYRSLNVALVPLIMAFALMAAVRIVDAIG